MSTASLLDMQRQPPDWMSQTHERILEYLAGLSEEGYGSPGPIAERYDRDPDYISRQTNRLERAGFVRILGQGVYQITEKGRALVAGEGDFSDVPDPDAPDDGGGGDGEAGGRSGSGPGP